MANDSLRRYLNGMVALLFVCAAVVAFGQGSARSLLAQGVPTASPYAPALPSNHPARGLIYDGLEPDGDQCPGGFRLSGTMLCTHGPDPAPSNVDIKNRLPARTEAPLIPLVQCDGDGASGNRVQMLYAHALTVADRFNDYLAAFRQIAADVDSAFQDSAAET